MRAIDLTGRRFERLVVVGLVPTTREGRKYRLWLCECDCGDRVVVRGGNLQSGNTNSCGCWKLQVHGIRYAAFGMSSSKFYQVWAAMKRRCENPRSHGYKWYGLRGIRVEWKSFREFHDDMHKSYLEHVEAHGAKNTTIERKDVNGNYCKDNCVWATWLQQGKNRRPRTVH